MDRRPTYHNWRNPDGNPALPSGRYEDIAGFCSSASVEKVKELDYVLTPGRYVGLADDEEGFDFNERFVQLKKEFEEQLKEESKLNEAIQENLKNIKPI